MQCFFSTTGEVGVSTSLEEEERDHLGAAKATAPAIRSEFMDGAAWNVLDKEGPVPICRQASRS